MADTLEEAIKKRNASGYARPAELAFETLEICTNSADFDSLFFVNCGAEGNYPENIGGENRNTAWQATLENGSSQIFSNAPFRIGKIKGVGDGSQKTASVIFDVVLGGIQPFLEFVIADKRSVEAVFREFIRSDLSAPGVIIKTRVMEVSVDSSQTTLILGPLFNLRRRFPSKTYNIIDYPNLVI